MKAWKQGIIGILGIIALALAFTACDDGNGKDDGKEQPEYREAEITFSFLDVGGSPVSEKKAKVQGTMLLADWNNAKTTIHNRINNIQNTATGFPRGRFLVVFDETQNTVIIFDPNAGNGKYEVKNGEWRKLYINPSALNSLTDADIQAAIDAMNSNETISE